MALSFANKQLPSATILMAVRWYVAYKLSYRNIEELLAERGVKVDHATIHRWVLEYAPQLESVFRSRKRPVSDSRQMLRNGQMKDVGEMPLWEQFYSLAV